MPYKVQVASIWISPTSRSNRLFFLQ